MMISTIGQPLRLMGVSIRLSMPCRGKGPYELEACRSKRPAQTQLHSLPRHCLHYHHHYHFRWTQSGRPLVDCRSTYSADWQPLSLRLSLRRTETRPASGLILLPLYQLFLSPTLPCLMWHPRLTKQIDQCRWM